MRPFRPATLNANDTSLAAPRIAGLQAFSNPAGDYLREGVQEYFREGFRTCLERYGGTYTHRPMYRLPGLVRRLGLVRESRKARSLIGVSRLDRLTALLVRIVGGAPRFAPARYSATINQYRLTLDNGKERSFCIDVADSPTIECQDLLDSSVAYFKTNFDARGGYPAHVFPLFNVGPGMIETLRRVPELRTRSKDYDLSFIVRVWGGTNEIDGIEHNLRLIEALSRVKCSKFFHVFLIAGDTRRIAERLEAQGIRCSNRPLPPEQCVEIAAKSRLSVVRHAIHSSIPWSTVEKMAVGSCVLLDHEPSMRWHVPLVRNRNFLCMDTDVDRETLVSTEKAYAALPRTVEGLLSDRRLVEEIGRNSAAYFDAQLSPEKAAEYILSTLLAQLARPSGRH